MTKNTYYNEKDAEKGNLGEQFFYRYYGCLTNQFSFQMESKTDERCAGKDFIGTTMHPARVCMEGPYELKTIYSQSFLKSCDLPFEMIDGKDKGEGIISYIAGWLYKYFYPETQQKAKATQIHGAVTPMMLVYIVSSDPDDFVPYAAIVFENFMQLEKRLKELFLKKFDLELNKENWPKTYDEWAKICGKACFGTWYVPFMELADLATVTMINDLPATGDTYQKAHFNALVKAAHGRYLNTQEAEKMIAAYAEKGEVVHPVDLGWMKEKMHFDADTECEIITMLAE